MRGIIRAAAREGADNNNKNKKNGCHEADDVNINSCLAERIAARRWREPRLHELVSEGNRNKAICRRNYHMNTSQMSCETKTQ